MQALAKCLFVFTLVTIPVTAEAQIAELLGFEQLPSNRAEGAFSGVQQTQFDDLDEVIPPPASEGMPFSPSDLSADTDDRLWQSPAESSEPITTPAPDALGNGAEDLEPGPQMGEYHGVASDAGFGQTFDIPIADMIPADVGEVFSTNNWFRGGRWYSKQELLMLLRTDLPPVHIAVDASQGLSDPFVVGALSTKDADFTFEAGTRLTIGKILGRDVANRDHSIDFAFFGLVEYTGRAQIEAFTPDTGSGIRSLLGSNEVFSLQSGVVGGFPIINNVNGFSLSRSQEILYQADLNSFELNYMIGARPARDRMVMQPDGRWVRHATPSRVRGMYTGFRYIRQNESFQYAAIGGYNRFVDGAGNIIRLEPIDEGGTYRVRTDNDLFGIHMGSEVVQKHTNWVVGLNGRVGGLLNFADRDSRLVQVFDNDDSANVNLVRQTESESLNDETLTFLGEANAFLAYYVRPNTSIRLGYNILYMNGLATATNNIGLVGSFPKFELTGDSLYHGLNMGFEMTW